MTKRHILGNPVIDEADKSSIHGEMSIEMKEAVFDVIFQ